MNDELAEHLASLHRDDSYRVDCVLKETPYERTEKVFFQGNNGSEIGPYIRKRIDCSAGQGKVYKLIFEKQQAGMRFVHLPRVIDFHQVGNLMTVIMEQASGETLDELVHRVGPSLQLASDIIPALCDAVSSLHNAFSPSIIHRDIKPSNIIVSANNLTLIDFGIAREYQAGSTQDTYHFGTKAYAPPEQFGFGQTDKRSDVYALGMVLCFCLTGETPSSQLRACGFTDPRIPAFMQEVIRKATALDPASRYQSAEELKKSLTQALSRRTSGTSSKTAYAHTPYRQDSATASFNAPFSSVKPVEGSRRPRSAIGHRLSRISPKAGATWNIVLLCTAALFLAACISLVFNPGGTESARLAGAPLWYRWTLYVIGTGMLFIVPQLYLVSDRRMWAKRIPWLAGFPLWKDIAVTCLIIFIGMVLIAFMA